MGGEGGVGKSSFIREISAFYPGFFLGKNSHREFSMTPPSLIPGGVGKGLGKNGILDGFEGIFEGF